MSKRGLIIALSGSSVELASLIKYLNRIHKPETKMIDIFQVGKKK